MKLELPRILICLRTYSFGILNAIEWNESNAKSFMAFKENVY